MKARQQGTVISGTNGLYYLRARYYDPTIGRFLTRDPLPGSARDPQSLNAYPYVRNNPVNRVDPTGMFTEGASGCQSDELLAAYFLGLAGFFGVVLPGAFLLTNPATFALGVALLEYVALPIEVASVALIAHACGVQLL